MRATRTIKRGHPDPRGATFDGQGVNFALFAEDAARVELCLFDGPQAHKESERVEMLEKTNGVFHVWVEGLRPGQVYGYRVHGPYDPDNRLRFNSNKLVFDPYAREVARRAAWDPALFGYTIGDPLKDKSFDERDSAPFAPLARVPDGAFDWQGDSHPHTAWSKTLIYEAHVKGLTQLHPGVPEALRGTYLGACQEPVIEHLKALGVTAIELLPVHFCPGTGFLVDKGLANYWGYDSLGFFAPDPRFATAPENAVREFKEMVRTFHRHGLEVILDVVYNHTAEGSELGPTLSCRGIDNKAYYRVEDYTACGNTLDLRHPRVLQLVMDSLRYWVQEMHVDGFRFDLAPVLARESPDFDPRGRFLSAVDQDPVLSLVKLIAEAWDAAPGGYAVGRFPIKWSEWNAKFRDGVRHFWKGEAGALAEFATRVSGSSDLYGGLGRRPRASVNYVACHDGFTLHDLCSYDKKRNRANKENNRDGEPDGHSQRCPPELKARRTRSMLGTVAVAQGLPMLLHGDEFLRTQRGNNNAYCQDNAISWVDWSLARKNADFLAFARKAFALRREHAVLRRRTFLHGADHDGVGEKDVAWFAPDGEEMGEDHWTDAARRSVGMRLSGRTTGELNSEGHPKTGPTLLILFHAGAEPVEFVLPEDGWTRLLDSDIPDGGAVEPWGAASYPLKPSGFAVLRKEA